MGHQDVARAACRPPARPRSGRGGTARRRARHSARRTRPTPTPRVRTSPGAWSCRCPPHRTPATVRTPDGGAPAQLLQRAAQLAAPPHAGGYGRQHLVQRRSDVTCELARPVGCGTGRSSVVEAVPARRHPLVDGSQLGRRLRARPSRRARRGSAWNARRASVWRPLAASARMARPRGRSRWGCCDDVWFEDGEGVVEPPGQRSGPRRAPRRRRLGSQPNRTASPTAHASSANSSSAFPTHRSSARVIAAGIAVSRLELGARQAWRRRWHPIGTRRRSSAARPRRRGGAGGTPRYAARHS